MEHTVFLFLIARQNLCCFAFSRVDNNMLSKLTYHALAMPQIELHETIMMSHKNIIIKCDTNVFLTVCTHFHKHNHVFICTLPIMLLHV